MLIQLGTHLSRFDVNITRTTANNS